MRYGRLLTSCTLIVAILATGCSGPESENASGSGAAGPQSTQAGGGGGEWVTLFDGSNLDNFVQTGDANWTIEGSSVRADSGSGMLVTRSQYDDFEIDLEFWVDVPANSGVFIRCPDQQDIGAATCYEVNIFDTRADQTYRTGAIVDVAAPATILYTGGRWNRYQISANGTRLHVVLNGEVTVDVDDSKHSAGYIGLQYGAGQVMFRNVRIRTL